MRYLLGMFLAFSALYGADPTITGDSGNWTHNGTITLTVTNAGTKPQAGPRVWDNGIGSGKVANNPNGRWTRGIPDANPPGQQQYDLQYRTAPYRGVSPPHSEDSGFIVGAHDYSATGAYDGGDVIMCKTVPVSIGDYVYARWYEQRDPNWRYCGDSGVIGCGTPDNNYKNFDWSKTGFYDSQNNWYTANHPGQPSCGGNAGDWLVQDNPGPNGPQQVENTWSSNSSNMCGSWRLNEHLVKVSNVANGGSVQIWDNGTRKLSNTATITQDWNTGNVSVCIGGFSRALSDDNFRFYDDLWIDNTRQMVLVCDQPTISDYWGGGNHGTCHPQPATSWSNTSITIQVNRAGNSGTKYVYVFNANGEHNSTGYAVTMGGSGSPAQCGDSLDNDGDGDVDLADSGCANANDTSEALCGDNFLDSGEDCDGSQLGGETCASQGHPPGGTLGCTAQCTFDESQCNVDTTTLRIENHTTITDVDPNATTYSFTHSITYPAERGIAVAINGQGDAASAACRVTGVTYAGQPLTEAVAIADSGVPNVNHASVWYRYNPPNNGPNSVALTLNGANCNRINAVAATLANVDASMVDEVGSDEEKAGGSGVSWATGALATNSLCLDTAILEDGGSLTHASAGPMVTLLAYTDKRIAAGSFTTAFNGGWNATNAQAGLPWVYAAACFAQKGGTPAVCGNNVLEGGEVCDGSALNGETCSSQGYAGGGSLACQSDCSALDTSNCVQAPLDQVPFVRRDDDH